MSVIEIVRALRHNRVNFVHGILRQAQLIPVMPRSEYKRSCDIDPRLKNELDKKGYSFSRWCLGREFDPVQTAANLKDMPEDVLGATHEAVRRDFPEVFFEMYGGARPPKQTWLAKSDLARPSVNISWEDALLKMMSIQRLQKILSYWTVLSKIERWPWKHNGADIDGLLPLKHCKLMMVSLE